MSVSLRRLGVFLDVENACGDERRVRRPARCAAQIRRLVALLRPHRKLLEPAARDFEPAQGARACRS